MDLKGNSKNSCLYKVTLKIRSPNSEMYYKVLRPDDVPVRGMEYRSELRDETIEYTFISQDILKIRSAIDDILEKIKLAEEVIKKSHKGDV